MNNTNRTAANLVTLLANRLDANLFAGNLTPEVTEMGNNGNIRGRKTGFDSPEAWLEHVATLPPMGKKDDFGAGFGRLMIMMGLSPNTEEQIEERKEQNARANRIGAPMADFDAPKPVKESTETWGAYAARTAAHKSAYQAWLVA